MAFAAHGVWPVKSDNRFSWDLVGATPDVVQHYQQYYADVIPNNFPCGFRLFQKMVIYVNDVDWYANTIYGTQVYQTNRVGADIWRDAVASEKCVAESGPTCPPSNFVKRQWP